MNSKRYRIGLGFLLAVLLISILAAATPQNSLELASARTILLGIFLTRECQSHSTAVQESVGIGSLIPACWLSQSLAASP